MLACSALKRRYRDALRSAAPSRHVVFIYLDAPRAALLERMQHRTGHYMPPTLLDSQLATLEPLASDEHGIVLDATAPPDTLVEQALALLQLAARISVLGDGVHRLVLADDRATIVKRRRAAPAGFFAMEAHGLELLRATQTLRVPLVHDLSDEAIVLRRSRHRTRRSRCLGTRRPRACPLTRAHVSDVRPRQKRLVRQQPATQHCNRRRPPLLRRMPPAAARPPCLRRREARASGSRRARALSLRPAESHPGATSIARARRSLDREPASMRRRRARAHRRCRRPLRLGRG